MEIRTGYAIPFLSNRSQRGIRLKRYLDSWVIKASVSLKSITHPSFKIRQDEALEAEVRAAL